MLKTIIEFDEKLFLLINKINHPILNFCFEIITNKWFFIIPSIIFCYLIVNEKENVFKRILFISFTVGFIDCTIYNIFKPLVHRLRPCHALELVFPNKVLGNCGGQFSFFSNHAGNAFGLIFCLILVFNTNSKFTKILYFWGILVCLSRVYVGVHYPLDVVFGAIYGILISKLFFNFYNKQIF